MKLIIAGVVLDIIAVIIVGLIIFLPMAVSDNAGLNAVYASFLCERGEKYVPTTIVTEDYDGTGYSLNAACVSERGETDVTPKQTIYGLIAAELPFLLGIGLTLIGSAQFKRRRNRPREVTAMLANNPQAGNPISNPQAENPISWDDSRR